ncbi:MAG: DUF928 domain-containing protein [Burkholderiales bacterium]|nr:DUF928 domain-containing protein [Burkholderiales bacterium]
MRLTNLLLIALMPFLAHTAFAAGADGAVGMVLDLQGSGQIKDSGSVSKLQLLSYLKPQMQVTLDDGSKASLTIYATRTVYQLTGPAVVEVAKDKLNVIQGKPPVSKTMQEKLVVAAENVNVTPGAYRMRGIPAIRVTSPENNSVIFGKRPTFRWNGPEKTTFDVVLQDDSDKEIVRTKVAGNSWELPSKLALTEGNMYRWTVSFKSSEGRTVSSVGEFTVATKSEAATLGELRPASSAPIEEWVLYAAMLRDRDMLDEEQTVWRLIYERRPDLQAARESVR